MNKGKKLGIWMDHSSAHLTELSNNPMVTKIIVSKFTHEDKEHSLDKGEGMMHKKEQHKHAEYYKEIGETIKNYDEVVLFGPTDAKSELFNILRSDHLFAKIKIEIKQTDKMSEYQQHEFVKDHFGKTG
jgi:stalled ribosome rescue protein Dom34